MCLIFLSYLFLSSVRRRFYAYHSNRVSLARARSLAAQTPPQKNESEVLKIDTRLINLNVKVLDASGKAVSQLKPEDFVITEDGQPQEIAYFQPVTAPVSLVLLLALSGSTEKKRKLMMKAAQRFLETLIPEDTVAVAAFTDQYYGWPISRKIARSSKKPSRKSKTSKARHPITTRCGI